MYKYNIQIDKSDVRDFKLNPQTFKANNTLSSVDLRPICPPVYDQGQEGSCTANAACAALSMLRANTGLFLSRAFLYYQERLLEGSTRSDSGASLRDTCKATKAYGVCEDSYMPYATTNYRTAPSVQAIKNALNYKINSYTRLSTLSDIKNTLALYKKPVILGMSVYQSMETPQVASTGILHMPSATDKLLGGHAVLIVGYIDNIPSPTNPLAGSLIIRNSWGANWGDKGYFYMPY